MLQRSRCNANTASTSDTPSVIVAMHLVAWLTGARTHQESVSLQRAASYCKLSWQQEVKRGKAIEAGGVEPI
jgi:hypothetical protein